MEAKLTIEIIIELKQEIKLLKERLEKIEKHLQRANEFIWIEYK